MLRHRSTLYYCGYDRLLSMDLPFFICGHDSFRFYMVPFCILCDHDSFISYTYVVSACIFMVIICIWTCMSQRSVFVWHLSLFQVPLFEPFDLGFSALSILSCFLYNVFRLLSSPLTSYINLIHEEASVIAQNDTSLPVTTFLCFCCMSTLPWRHFKRVTEKIPNLEDPYLEFCNSIWPHLYIIGKISVLAKTF